MLKPMDVLLILGVVLAPLLCLVPVLWGFVHSILSRAWKTAVALGIAAAGIIMFCTLGLPMLKPMGVLLLLGLVLALLVSLVPVLWGIVDSIRNGARKTAVALGIAAAGIVVFSAWAVYAAAPKGGRTIAELELSNGRAVVLRHYRFGWLEYPKVRFYARGTEGAWTSFALISELVNPNTTSLVLDASAQEIHVAPVGGWYLIQNNDFVNVDGSRNNTWQLPPGIEPGEEDILGSGQKPQLGQSG